MAYLCLLSANHLISLWGTGYSFYGVGIFGYNIWSVIAFALVYRLLFRAMERRDRRMHVVAGVGGLLLGAAIVYGTYAHFVNDIFIDVKTVLLQFGLVLGLAAVTIPCVEEIFVFFGRVQDWYTKQQTQVVQRKPALCFLVGWAVIFIAYIPLFLANWPGNFVFDAKYQLQEVLADSYSTHHPVLHTLLMGWAYKLGLQLGNVSVGYQFYTIFQMLVLSGAFAYVVAYLYRRGAPKSLCIGVLLWFALFPLHGLFAISATKDVLFAAFFLYMMVFLVRILFDKEAFCWHSYVGLVVSGILAMLFRNNAMYAIVAGGVLITLFYKGLGKGWKNRLRILVLVLVMFVGCRVSNRVLVAATSARSSDTYRETLCVPLQCLARVASYHRNELAEEDYREICSYIQESDLVSYNPYNADGVKNNADELALRSNLINFLKLWVKLGLQFPEEYLESIITNTLGYWYPVDRGDYAAAGIALYHTLIGTEQEIVKQSYCAPAEKVYNYLFYEGNYRETPILGYLFRPDAYVWLLAVVFLWGMERRDKRVTMVSLIPLLYLGTCFLGPMAALRYVYCLIVSVPLFVYLVAAGRMLPAKTETLNDKQE